MEHTTHLVLLNFLLCQLLCTSSRQSNVFLSLSNTSTNDHITHRYSTNNPHRQLSISSVYHYLPDADYNVTNPTTIRSNHRCWEKSVYSAVFIDLGFRNGVPRNDSHQISKFKYKYEGTSPFHIGCYGLNIRRCNISFYMILQNIYLKSNLYETVAQYTDSRPSFLPLTFHMRNPSERIFFFQHILPCNDTSNSEWLFKQNMHQGYGIEFIDNAIFFRRAFLPVTEQFLIDPHCVVGNFDATETETNKIRAKNYQLQRMKIECEDNLNSKNCRNYANANAKSVKIKDDGANDENMKDNNLFFMAKSDTIIAQKFVSNVLTLNGRKFHFRAYYLIGNYGEPFILLYGGTLLYISALQYNATFDARNKTMSKRMAITNRAVSKELLKHEMQSDENLWNLTYFAEYVDAEIMESKSAVGEVFKSKFEEWNYKSGEQWIERVLETELKDIARTVFRAAIADIAEEYGDVLDGGSEVQSYDLLAMDLLMTTDLELKLMEVQSGPMSSFVCDRCKDNLDFGFVSNKDGERYWACDFGQQLAEEEINIELEIQMKKKFGLSLNDPKQFKSFHYWKPILWE